MFKFQFMVYIFNESNALLKTKIIKKIIIFSNVLFYKHFIIIMSDLSKLIYYKSYSYHSYHIIIKSIQ